MNDKPIKIAYLLEYPIDLPGGAQMSTESLCMGLINKGYEPVVVCPELLHKSKSDYPFEIITYPMGEKRIPNLLVRIKSFRRIIKQLRPDIVHIQMPESLITYGLTGIRSYKGGGPRLVFTDRGLFYGYRKHSLLLMKNTLKRADLMLTTTDFNKKMWEDGTNIRPIGKVANTISDKFLQYDEGIRAEKEKQSSGRLRIGMAGRICEEKNWPFAVSLIKKIADAGIDIDVKLVLSVFEAGDDKKVLDINEGIAAAIGREKLEFHQDYSQEEMSQFYYDVDVFVMTSQFESFGKAAVEAMSRHCAVISTDVGGLSEVIGKKDNLYTVDTVDKAVEYIKRVAENRELLREEQEFFYKRYLDCFSQERCLKDHMDIYNSLV